MTGYKKELSVEELRDLTEDSPMREVNSEVSVMSYELAARHQILKQSRTENSPVTGFEPVDRYLKALLPESLTVLGAESSVGKTTFAANIAANIAAIQKKKVLFFSLESGFSITKIIASYLSKKPESELTDQDIRQDIETLRIVAPTGQITLSDIEKTALLELPEVIILDHIHYLVHSGDNLAGNIANTVRGLNMLARRLKTHIIVISHLKKPDRGQENQIPSIYSLKDSSALYQDPANVILISRKRKDVELLQPGEDVFEQEGLIIVAKNRDFGETGIARFIFDKKRHTFII